ncbi:hypothetical protein L226DRAFT_331805 [Lentinus tigrinus ALCF2SS1-7]|uniref:uncharacterized protein n=1 Tax=Lentinus tigrinus ALCF2SS1-7 TaxID=1328758 RepID=UPI00116634BF|nr:hypothetical protein L226DRAFT_331805 [Lentinus tigrinus ALCF2SS1-7]
MWGCCGVDLRVAEGISCSDIHRLRLTPCPVYSSCSTKHQYKYAHVLPSYFFGSPNNHPDEITAGVRPQPGSTDSVLLLGDSRAARHIRYLRLQGPTQQHSHHPGHLIIDSTYPAQRSPECAHKPGGLPTMVVRGHLQRSLSHCLDSWTLSPSTTRLAPATTATVTYRRLP